MSIYNYTPWHAKYVAEEWSLTYSMELPEGTKPGDLVDCGDFPDLEDLVEDLLPGTYQVSDGDTDLTLIIPAGS